MWWDEVWTYLSARTPRRRHQPLSMRVLAGAAPDDHTCRRHVGSFSCHLAARSGRILGGLRGGARAGLLGALRPGLWMTVGGPRGCRRPGREASFSWPCSVARGADCCHRGRQ